MKNSATIESLKGMRFGAMATELERQLQDPATYAHMGFEERVALLVDAEWNSRQNNKLIRCIREARFAEPGAAVEDTMKTGIWIRHSFYGLPPVTLFPRATTLFSREPLATARPTSPVPWAMPPAESCCRCGISDSQSFWRNCPWLKPQVS